MKYLIKIFALATITTHIIMSCNVNKRANVVLPPTKDTNHFPNITQVKIIGDSMRIEIEQKGDTAIKHYIDLNGSAGGDKFDDSFTATCIYSTRYVDSIVVNKKQKIKIKAILTEQYETEFSGGRNFFFITQNGDTLGFRHFVEFMR